MNDRQFMIRFKGGRKGEIQHSDNRGNQIHPAIGIGRLGNSPTDSSSARREQECTRGKVVEETIWRVEKRKEELAMKTLKQKMESIGSARRKKVEARAAGLVAEEM